MAYPSKLFDLKRITTPMSLLINLSLLFVSTPCLYCHCSFTLQVSMTLRNKKLLGTLGIATRNKDATRGLLCYY